MSLRIQPHSAARCWLLALCVVIAGQARVTAAEWTSFHNGGNTSIDAADLPTQWSPEKGIRWKIKLPGYGQSAPVRWGDVAILTAVVGKQKETAVVLACDVATGKVAWQRELPTSIQGPNSSSVSRAAPTPMVDSAGIYALFESGDLFALTHDGKDRWHVKLFDDADRKFQNGHGYGASPAQTDKAVIVLVDHAGPSYLQAIDKQNGKPLWTTERKSRTSWASPHVSQVGDKQLVIVSSNGTVDGYDAADGKALWSHDGITGNTVPSASVQADRVFVGANNSRRNPNADVAAKSNCCLQIQPGSETGYQLLWQAEKAVCSYISPLAHKDCVYYVNNVGVLYCLDAKTGQQHYAERIAGTCWAQPIAVGERIYFFGRNGTTSIVKAGPEFEQLAANVLWSAEPKEPAKTETKTESKDGADGKSKSRRSRGGGMYLDPIVYAAIPLEDAFLVRTGDELFCIGKPRLAANPTR